MATTRQQQIAHLVRAARVERGWSQTELAEKVGVHKQTIGNLERASHESGPELVQRLEEVLVIDLSATSLASTAAIDMVHAELLAKIRELGEVRGLLLVAETLNFVQEWTAPSLRGRDGRSGEG